MSEEIRFIKIAADYSGAIIVTSHQIIGDISETDIDRLILDLQRAKQAAAVMRGEQPRFDGPPEKPITELEIAVLHAVDQLVKAHDAANGKDSPQKADALAAVITAGRLMGNE